MILYAPLVITVAALLPVSWMPVLLLALAVTSLFLSRNVLGLLIRQRGDLGTVVWLAVYLAVAGATALPLFLYYHRLGLWTVGSLAAGLFAAHALLQVLPARKRLDRSQWGEILSVGALALTSPAAYVVVIGHLDAMAWCLWTTCTLYFSSSIFFVKMLLSAVKVKGEFGWRERWRIGRDNMVYHVLLIIMLVWVTFIQSGLAAVLAVIAYLPALMRAFRGWATLTNKLPSLRRVGIGETLYALWFTGFFLATLRVGE